jgi:hypothetical protein
VDRAVLQDVQVRRTIEPGLEQILRFCAEDPIERVFLEDVARRGLGRFTAVAQGRELTALCHVGANVVPSGTGCGAFADAAARGRARMVIGEEQAVGELWAEAGEQMPLPRQDRPGQPVYVLEEAPAVCLFVRAENAAAIRVYEAIGMRRVGTYRSLIF